MKRFISTASMLALVTGATLSGTALAQEETISQEEGVTTLEAITVTANRTQTELSKTGSTVVQVSQEEIEEKSFFSVTDYLTRLPGVAVASTGGIGSQTNIFIRGLSGKYVKTLYNGIDVSDPANSQVQTNYEHLLTGGVTGIELLKGSQSTLYGSSAIAGVVDIVTLGQIGDGISHTVHVEGGSFGTARARYGFAGAKDDSKIAANLSAFRTDGISAAAGFPERDGYQNLTFDLAAEHRINEAFSVFGSFLHIKAKGEYDDWGADNLLNRNTAAITGGRAGFDLDFLDGRLKNRFSIQASHVDREDFGRNPGDFLGDRLKFDYQGAFEATDRVLLQYGADHERQRAKTLSMTGSTDLAGLWAQAVVEPIDNLMLTAGLRHDNHSKYGGHTTYRSTMSYLFNQSGTRLHASFGTGFRAPSLYELYDMSYESANPDLQPEKSRSFDIGVEQKFLDDRLTADVTYFQLAVDNRIDYNSFGKFEQIEGTTRSNGIEASFIYAANDWLELGGSYTYTDSRHPNGTQNHRIPRHVFMFAAVARPAEKWTISSDVKFVADTIDYGPVVLKDYVLLNAKVAYQVNDSSEIYLRGENLLNQKYKIADGYGTPGIAAYAGFKANF